MSDDLHSEKNVSQLETLSFAQEIESKNSERERERESERERCKVWRTGEFRNNGK